jgi:hypothetical protein
MLFVGEAILFTAKPEILNRTPMIHEAERRWADWRYGQPVDLPNGETWHFYEPETVVCNSKPGWTFEAPTPEVDAELSRRFERLIGKWGRAKDDAERASAILEAAWFLLARNYAISRQEFESVLSLASSWDEGRQERLGEHLVKVVGGACVDVAALMGAPN